MIYVTILLVAIALNISHKKNLLLTLVVGLSGLIPMHMVTEYYTWWAICLGFELFKIFLCLTLITRLTYPLLFINGLMFACHMSLFMTTNWQPHTIIIPVLEHIEVVSCVLFSVPLLAYLKRKFKCHKI